MPPIIQRPSQYITQVKCFSIFILTPPSCQKLNPVADQEDIINSAKNHWIPTRPHWSILHSMDKFMSNAQPCAMYLLAQWKKNGEHFLKLSKRYRNEHGSHRNGPLPTAQPPSSSDWQCNMRRICHCQHLPTAFKIHGHAILLGQRQIQIRTIYVIFDGWRTQFGRLMQQAPPHHPSLVKMEHISSTCSGRQ